MKVTFVVPAYLNEGVEYLSAVLRKEDHETEVVFDPKLFDDSEINVKFLAKFFNYKSEVIHEVIKSNPDLIVFSVVSDYYKWACDLAKCLKERINVPIIFGGIHVTSVPELVLKNDFVDMICIGDGELPLKNLVASIAKGNLDYKTQGIWFKKNGKVIRNSLARLPGLDCLPFPDKEIFRKKLSASRYGYGIVTARGCPFSCTYCGNSVLKKVYKGTEYMRRRSVNNVIEELRFAKKKYEPNCIWFWDDTFTFDIVWLKEFAKEYKKEIGIPYFCITHPNLINKEIVHLLKDSGCYKIEIGIQSFSEDVQRKILNRYTPRRKIKESLQLLRKAKIDVMADYILGLPGQTIKELEDFALFCNEHPVNKLEIMFLRYYPKTDIVNIAKEKGMLNDAQIGSLESCQDIKGYTLGGDVYSRDLAKLQLLYNSIGVFPKSLVSVMVKNKLYRFLPPLPLFFSKSFFRLFKLRKYDLSMVRILKKYFYFSFKKILNF